MHRLTHSDYHAPFEDSGIYHILNRGINGTTVFKSDRNRSFFCLRMKTYLVPYFDIWAWALLGNHFHLLLRIKPLDEAFYQSVSQENIQKAKFFLREGDLNNFLEEQFRRLFTSYAKAFNAEQDRYGGLFVKRFNRIRIKSSTHAMRLIRYINRNPVHHRFVEHPNDWRFSSYGETLAGVSTMLDIEGILGFFNGDVAQFESFHEIGEPDKLGDYKME